MPYNPTVNFIADIQELADGEQGCAAVFNRPLEQLDSRTLYLKAQIELNDSDITSLQGDVATALGDINTLQQDVSNLQGDLSGLSAEGIAWPGTLTIPSAANLAAAVDQAALMGAGGGGGSVIVRFGATSLAGTVITHNFGNTNHAVSIQLATVGSLTASQAANVGEFYVVRGVNTDTVYSTGSLEGLLFDYLATPFATSGTILAGAAVLGSLTGTVITHNLGNDVHSTQIFVSSTSAISAAAAATVGAIYVVRGTNADTVYNTGTNNTLGFTYIVS